MATDFDEWAQKMVEKYGPDSDGGGAGVREPRRPKKPSNSGEAVPEKETEKVPVPV